MRDAFAFMVASLICMVSLVCPPPSDAGNQVTYLTMGAKRIFEPYYPVAGTIANTFNRQQSPHGTCITVWKNRPTESIVASVLSGEFKFRVVHLSRIHQAYNGLRL